MANIMKTSRISKYNKMSVKDKQNYLNSLDRGDALELMRDIGYKEGFDDGVEMSNKKISLVDESINYSFRNLWINSLYTVAIIISTGFLAYKLEPTRLSMTFLIAFITIQIYFVLAPISRLNKDNEDRL